MTLVQDQGNTELFSGISDHKFSPNGFASRMAEKSYICIYVFRVAGCCTRINCLPNLTKSNIGLPHILCKVLVVPPPLDESFAPGIPQVAFACQ